MQLVRDLTDDRLRTLELPAAHARALPGVAWGRFDEFFTPAFWAARAWQFEPHRAFEPARLGTSLQEEVSACLLGGYGIPAEVGLAAYERIVKSGVLSSTATAFEIQQLLFEPLMVRGRRVRYRFYRQKARHLADSLERLRAWSTEPSDDRELRSSLAELPGVGLKTASWITRNWRASDAVAILDIHICRACSAMRVFDRQPSPSREYEELEERFLRFATAIGVRASVLDNLMWHTMRSIGHLLN
jgi:thermostable 8-oxoguanine DNA glycosylase